VPSVPNRFPLTQPTFHRKTEADLHGSGGGYPPPGRAISSATTARDGCLRNLLAGFVHFVGHRIAEDHDDDTRHTGGITLPLHSHVALDAGRVKWGCPIVRHRERTVPFASAHHLPFMPSKWPLPGGGYPPPGTVLLMHHREGTNAGERSRRKACDRSKCRRPRGGRPTGRRQLRSAPRRRPANCLSTAEILPPVERFAVPPAAAASHCGRAKRVSD
jgi:hypothetical protein